MPTVKSFVRYASLCLLLWSGGVGIARAQADAQPCSKANEIKDFVKISDMRDNLQVVISDLEDEVEALNEKMPQD
jgi:hypothetical protein